MSSLPLPAVYLLFGAFGALALLLVRTKTNGEEEGFALIGAAAFVGGIAGAFVHVAVVYLPALQDHGREHWPWWIDAPVCGCVLGFSLYMSLHLWHAAQRSYLWACRRRDEEETPGFRLRRHLWTVAAMAVLFTAILALNRVGVIHGPIDKALEWVITLLAVSALPLYQTWVLPWFLYYRGRTLDAREHGEVREWLEHVRKTRDLPGFHVRVQEGEMVNALALGGLRRYFIVLGRGLLTTLSAEHIKAVLAHEIGHIVNRDTTWRAAAMILGSAALHLVYFQFVVFQQDSLLKELICVAIGAPVFWVILPGLWQRRWEYHADRKAVEIMGDAEVVGQSLVCIYDANNVHVDAPGWPHPSLRARLKAIGFSGANEAPGRAG